MIKLMSIGSSSSGNCTYVEIGGKKLLIDLGLSTKKISAALAGIGISPGELDAVFITHTHSDHISAIPVILKKLNCPIYMSELSKNYLKLDSARILNPGDDCKLSEGIRVRTFETSHDCPGSMGFRFDCGNDSIGYATDLGHVSENIREILKGAHTVVLESNHDVSMLKAGHYSYPLKQRILSDSGHLSNESCGKTAKFLSENGTKRIFLAHLSTDNNTPALARNSVAKALESTGTDFYIFSQFDCKLYIIE